MANRARRIRNPGRRTRDAIRGLRQQIAGISNEHVEAWKAAGKPVVGYFCTYVPVEVLTAAGVLPLRLRGTGSDDSAAADVYLSGRTCTYVRHTLALALDGHYDFLDGQICLNTCDHVRRAHDVWRHKTGIGYHGFLSVPRNARESLYPYYREEVQRLIAELGEHVGATVDDAALEAAIGQHNRIRERLRRLDALRAEDPPLLKGSDLLTLSVAALVLPPEVFVEQADALLAVVEDDPPAPRAGRARLLLAGGELDEPGLIEAIESQGAEVVADTLCAGGRSYDVPVPEGSDDPLDAICRRYFFQVSCARMIGNFPDRVEALMARCAERGVDGVVFQRLTFCDPWGGEVHNLRHRLKPLGMPMLVLEREYGRVPTGQVRTRVQAFLELIESGARREEKGQSDASGGVA